MFQELFPESGTIFARVVALLIEAGLTIGLGRRVP